jgi:hypothetical protein
MPDASFAYVLGRVFLLIAILAAGQPPVPLPVSRERKSTSNEARY